MERRKTKKLQIHIRVTEAEKKIMINHARLQNFGENLSSYIRFIALRGL